jgi:iron(III) transport system substrate-binding protein
MTQRLSLEKDKPNADVFWGNEPMNTAYLADLGVFEPLPAGVDDGFPAERRDAKRRYVEFAGRVRILLVNTELLPDPATWPTSVSDLVDPKWGGEKRRAAVAKPLTGSTYTHAVTLLSRDEAAAKAFWQAVAERAKRGEVKTVPGNGAVMQQVADSKNGVAFGLTDTDDARVAIARGAPVAVVYPDQGEGRPGALVFPNTLALVRKGSHPAGAARLLSWLASKDVERRLAESPIANVPVRDDVPAPSHVKRPGRDFRAMSVDWSAVGANRDRWLSFLQNLFEK